MRVGLWMIGAAGNVATTVATGLAHLRGGGRPTTALLTETPAFAATELVTLQEIAIGGHDLEGRSPADRVEALAREGVLPASAGADARAAAAELSEGLRTGVTAAPPGTDARPLIEKARDDMASFASEHRLDRVVVVNLASTEAQIDGLPARDAGALDSWLRGGSVPASVLYACAAIELGFGYVNFTPSLGACIPALETLAAERGAVLAGRDGKTGETLVKAALAPMFAARNLRVLTWFGQNILGNSDGESLTDPAVRASKARSKGALLPAILGYEPAAYVGIDYVPNLGDWKIAWDHIQFEGFLGTRMSMQVTWQGADSILAAPLVIDLVRLVDLALRRNESGPLGYLAAFFKDPIACERHALGDQLHMLIAHTTKGRP